ncbi:hypothetical protein Tco_0591740 [Tanacetum coccineum]
MARGARSFLQIFALKSSSSACFPVQILRRVYGLESVEARLVYYKKNETVLEDSINVLKLEVRLRDNALDVYKLNLEKAKAERDQLKQTLEKFQNSSKSLNEILECQSGSDKAYHAVPPPLSRNFLPGKPDLTFIDEIVESENLDVTTVVTPSNEKTVENKGVFNTVESNTVRRECCAPINEELVSDGKKKTVVPTIPKVDVVRPKQQEKPVRKIVNGNPKTNMEDFSEVKYSPKDKSRAGARLTNKMTLTVQEGKESVLITSSSQIKLLSKNLRFRRETSLGKDCWDQEALMRNLMINKMNNKLG